MLQLINISHEIDGISLFRDIQWTINPQKRVALIGPNGSGKTTLLRLICKVLPVQQGEIVKPKTYQIGYLPQEEISFGRVSVLEEVLEANQLMQSMEEEKKIIRRQLEDPGIETDQQRTLVDRLGYLEERFQFLGGYSYKALAKKILIGLGFKENEFNDSIDTKSGGWRMRVYLARLLLQNPDLLLLDEPTNHLDIESLEWLESYLLEFKGSMIIVSHDRYFIDRLGEEIAELEHGQLTHYPGKYDYYIKEKALRLQQLEQKAEEVRAEKERLTRFINRFRYKNTKAPQVQDRIKRLEKLQDVKLPPSTKKIHFQITSPVKSYKDVCKFKDVGFRYTTDWIFENINLQLFRGEKAALVGANGEGKTTLTKLISGQLGPQKGELNLGERVSIGYYAQHQIDTLNKENSIYQEVYSTAAENYRVRIRDILGIFKFSGDDIDKNISILSGGEKARVSLAKILISPVNFLLMDEPTNHLDLDSKKALEKALKYYDGTLLLISHDRYFLDQLVSIVFELKNGILNRFEGNYSAYLEKKRQTYLSTEEPAEEKWPAIRKGKNQKRLEAESRQKISHQRKFLNERIEQLESEMEKLETEKKEIESNLAEPDFYRDQVKAAETGKRYQELQELIPKLFDEWEAKQNEKDKLLEELKVNRID
jgi:ATP-binding cassette subfamily F protein 3